MYAYGAGIQPGSEIFQCSCGAINANYASGSVSVSSSVDCLTARLHSRCWSSWHWQTVLVTGPDAAYSGMRVAREVHPWAGRTCGHSRTRSPCWCLLLSRVFHIDDVNLAHNSPNAASALSVHGLSLTRGSGGSGCSVVTSCLTSAYELSLASALDRASSNACLVIATGTAARHQQGERVSLSH